MDLKTGRLFWPEQSPPPPVHPTLERDVRCDVAVLGAGLTGALVAHGLARAGLDVVMVDKRTVAGGSTGASTALILYEIDKPLFELIERRGRDQAVRSYRRCLAAIGDLERIAGTLGPRCRFARRPSLYLAHRRAAVGELKRELEVRRDFGFEVDYLTRRDIEKRFSFSAPGALWSRDAAEIDPYAFTRALAARAAALGLRIFTNGDVQRIERSARRVTLHTASGPRIVSGRLVVAAGFESVHFFRRRLVRLNSTYVVTTQVVADLVGWPERCLIWDSARPYHYLRTTHDGRIMIGGGDEKFSNAKTRDALLPRKTRQLQRRLAGMFPHSKPEAPYAWAGTFGDTKDGLPYIDSHGDAPNVLYALCYGANGTNFAMIAADLARDWALGKRNPDASLFAFDR